MKYSPSLKNNSALKDEAAQMLKKLVYKMEKGKYPSDFNSDAVAEAAQSLKSALSTFEDSIGTGKEDVYGVYKSFKENFSAAEKMMSQKMFNRFETAIDDLIYSVEFWRDILSGITVWDEETIKDEKASWKRKSLDLRLNEMAEIKMSLAANVDRIRTQIVGLEKDLSELNDSIVGESNERKVNELYREVTSVQSKIDLLALRSGNYSACFNLLDIIHANVSEIISASVFSGEDFGKAKAFLSIVKLKNILQEPEKAIAVLRCMESDIKVLADKTKVIDAKISGANTGTTEIHIDAMAYKAELMKKKQEAEKKIAEAKKAETEKIEAEEVKEETIHGVF